MHNTKDELLWFPVTLSTHLLFKMRIAVDSHYCDGMLNIARFTLNDPSDSGT